MARNTSKITLFRGVELDPTYKKVIDFSSDQKFRDWLWQFHENWSMDASYQSLNRPVRWPTNDLQYNDLLLYNYLCIEDVDPDGKERYYYAYITDYVYKNDGTSYLYYSLDFFNTYRWKVSYNHAFIKQGFVQERTADNTKLTEDFEAIKNNAEEIGGDGAEMLLYSARCSFTPVGSVNSHTYLQDGTLKFVLFTTSPQDAKNNEGTLIGAYSQYLYHFIAYNTNTGKLYKIHQHNNVLFDQNMFIDEAYQELSKNPAFAGSSSLVVDSQLFNYLGLEFYLNTDQDTIYFTAPDSEVMFSTDNKPLVTILKAPQSAFKYQDGIAYRPSGHDPLPNSNLLNFMLALLQKQYGYKEIPLKMIYAPWTRLYLTNGRGAETNIDLNNMNDLYDANFQIRRFGGISENNHEQYALLGYNRRGTDDQNLPVTYENSQMIDDASRDTPIVLDYKTMFLNSNRNQLANSRVNAKINEHLAKEGNQISLNNANRSIDAGREAQTYSQGRAQNMATIQGGVNGAMSGLAAGGLLGAIGGGLTGAIMGNVMTGYNNTTQLNSADINRGAQRQNLADNNAFQNELATNNYEQTLRSQNAMLADVSNHNSQVAHEGTNYLMDMQINNKALHWQLFGVQPAVFENVRLWFLMFGYTINQYAPIENFLHVKTKFNYVKVSNPFVTGEVSKVILDFFNSMFYNGVTFWNENYIGDYINNAIQGNEFVHLKKK